MCESVHSMHKGNVPFINTFECSWSTLFRSASVCSGRGEKILCPHRKPHETVHHPDWLQAQVCPNHHCEFTASVVVKTRNPLPQPSSSSSSPLSTHSMTRQLLTVHLLTFTLDPAETGRLKTGDSCSTQSSACPVVQREHRFGKGKPVLVPSNSPPLPEVVKGTWVLSRTGSQCPGTLRSVVTDQQSCCAAKNHRTKD